VWILPRYHSSRYEGDDDEKLSGLAEILAVTEGSMDRVLKRPPYNMFLHNSPLRAEENEYYHWHLEVTPRLSRVAGFEWGSGFYINTVPPEDAAKYLRE
jgi:UDPglucose--hexose-1-phosphate uridylyltransferase